MGFALEMIGRVCKPVLRLLKYVTMVAGSKQFFFILSFLFVSGFAAKAQQNRFIYLQSDNRQPFYVKLQTQVWSSTASGYLILSKLTEGKYDFKIGFPKNEWPEQTFTCTVGKKDLGYNIKNLSKGWGLLNMQTGEIIPLSGKTPEQKAKLKEPVGDDFSNLLANIVNDPAIRQAGNEETIDHKTADQPIAQNTVLKSNPITKVGENDNNSGRHITYIDKEDQRTDTVQVLIPAVSPGTARRNAEPNGDIQPGSKANKPVIDTKASITTNTACKKMATDNEVILLKKKMFGGKAIEDKIAVAEKTFKSKCLTTAQVMTLAELFPGDAAKYKFFNAAYAHTSDKEKYSTLKSQLKEERYIGLFNAML
jgi:hypothetical protein